MSKMMIVLITLVFCLMAESDEFGARMNATIKSLPASVDLAGMGGLNVCLPTPSGINPAANATLTEYGIEKAIYISRYWFDFSRGPEMEMNSLSGVAELGGGVLKLTYYNLLAPESRVRKLGDVNHFSAESLEISYGLKASEKLLLGLTVIPFSDSFGEVNINGLAFGSGRSRSFGISAGLMYRPIRLLNFSLTGDLSQEKTNYQELGFKSNETAVITAFRPGISVQPWQGGTFGAEWSCIKVESDKAGSDLHLDRWFVGGEQWLSEHFAVRAGLLAGGPTFGAGLRIGKDIFLDYAFVSQPANSLERYWGKADCHLLSLTIAF